MKSAGAKAKREPIQIGGTEIAAGERASVRIPVARRYTQADIFLPAHVIHGRRPGPRLFVSAAIHGDEINGVEIIRRLLRVPALEKVRGTLIAVPIVNIYGFLGRSRYLPDGRDLNRSFPGSATGSLAARLAHQFMSEVAKDATHGIDLHTGAGNRSNLPQIRACLDDEQTARLAEKFGVPVVLNANLRDGSLRQAVLEKGIPMLVYEAGEALRFDEAAIRAGIRGVLSVMRELEMLPKSKSRPRASDARPFVARSSAWVRAPEGGILKSSVALGDRVETGDCLATVSDPLGDEVFDVCSKFSGIVIGKTELPLINEGDALYHIASIQKPDAVAEHVEDFAAELALDSAGESEEQVDG